MALQRLEYEVHRDEPLESTQAFIRSLDSHDRPDTIVYQNIQGNVCKHRAVAIAA